MYHVISFLVYYLTKVTAVSSFKELHTYLFLIIDSTATESK